MGRARQRRRLDPAHYDAYGQRRSETDANGRTTEWLLGAFGQTLGMSTYFGAAGYACPVRMSAVLSCRVSSAFFKAGAFIRHPASNSAVRGALFLRSLLNFQAMRRK